MFACCLEDAGYEAAEEAFAALVHTFFDWNEVRVTSLSELSEVMAGLPDPRVASNRIKRVLHGIFEANYSFDLEDKRKKNLGPTVKWLEKLDGTTQFTVAYVVQAAWAATKFPSTPAPWPSCRILDLVTEKDAAAGVVPGLERAVAKSKGIEFGSLLHQLGADYTANPFSPAVREMLLQIDPAAKERFPQRRAAKGSADRAGRGTGQDPVGGKTRGRKTRPDQAAQRRRPQRRPAAKASRGRRGAGRGRRPRPRRRNRQAVAGSTARRPGRRAAPRPAAAPGRNGRESVLVGGTRQTQTTLDCCFRTAGLNSG